MIIRISFHIDCQMSSFNDPVPISLIDNLMNRLVNHFKKVSTNIREIYYEDFEDMNPYEVLEFMNITDYERYLDKNLLYHLLKLI